MLQKTQIGQGVTSPSDWQDYVLDGSGFDYDGVYVDINTSACGFTSTPHYIVTLESVNDVPRAGSGKWEVSGYNAIYNATPEGFRVYARWTDGELNRDGTYSRQLTADQAEEFRYVIRWTAISTIKCNPCSDMDPDPNAPPADTTTTNLEVIDVTVNDLDIFPNPAGSILNIKTADRVLGVRIFSTSGALMQEYREEIKKIDISKLSAGSYVVEVSLPSMVKVTKQFIKR